VVSRIGRLFLILVGILLTLKLQSANHGHGTLQKGAMAFLNGASQPLVILKGDVLHPGVYIVSDDFSLLSVIKLAEPSVPSQRLISPDHSLKSVIGKKIRVYVGRGNCIEITEENATTCERMLLGQPLQPDLLTEEDWLLLPGIGPVMARRIIADRQINGDYGQFDRLNRVEGIGATTLAKLAPYFQLAR
jgi:competence protein ComEA